MSPFHSGMNHWQRQWLSDRLHKKHEAQPVAATLSQPAPTTKRRVSKTKKAPVDQPKGGENP
jgi:predicted alpha/beta hydrolase family esterase